MRGFDDSSQTDPALRTPHSVLSDEEFKLVCARYDKRFMETEDDPDQQDSYEARGGPGRTTFHPADRPTQPHPIVKPHSSGETQSRYCPYDQEPIIAACRSAISVHQMAYGIDPLQIRISTTMYFDLSEAKRTMYNSPFTGKLSFLSISDKTEYIDVRVYSDISTNIVICIH